MAYTPTPRTAILLGMDIEQVWSAALGALALIITHLAGSRRRSAWALGLVAQFGWAGFILYTGTYGFLVSFVGFTVVYLRNWVKWGRQSTETSAEPETADTPSSCSICAAA